MDKITRALVVEDDLSWQQILGEILTDSDIEVDYACDRQEAFEKITRQAHRFAILDLSLGGTDHRNQEGLIVAELVRRHDPSCEIIFLTGFATVELAVKVMRELGAVSCLRKEVFRRSDFRNLIDEILRQPPILSVGRIQGALEESYVHPNALPGENVELGIDQDVALVIEDDAGWRNLLTELLEEIGLKVIISSSYIEALALFKREKIVVTVLDLSLANSEPQENMDGYRLLNHASKYGVPVVVVSGYIDPLRIEQAYAGGLVVSCLEKQAFDRRSFTQAIAAARSKISVEDPLLKSLTDREREVLELIALGLTNKEIAQRLTITSNTVKRHLKSLFVKLNVNTRSAASALAVSLRLGKD